MAVDQKIFDLFTVIDNLIARQNEIQLQNNALLQQNNLLLAELLQKPTVLEAPQLTQLNIEQLTTTVPENIDLTPQLYYDIDANKYYIRTKSFILGAYAGTLAAGATLTGQKQRIDVNIKLVAAITGLQPGEFDLIRFVSYKNLVFNIMTAGNPGVVTLDFFKNDKKIMYLQLLPDQDEPIEFDRSDTDFYFTPSDVIQSNYTNNTPNIITVYTRVYYSLFRRIDKELFEMYYTKIKDLLK